MHKILNDIEKHVAQAVSHYWLTRKSQKEKQKNRGVSDAGLRSAVTGGAQMDGFIALFKDLIVDAGMSSLFIHEKKALQLPGFFRPTKEWDLLLIKDGQLIVAIEAKSQVGPSFGNNFNNRTEEAMGSALDLWTAFREGAFMEVSNLSLVISLCSKIVKPQIAPLKSENLISRYFLNSLMLHI